MEKTRARKRLTAKQRDQVIRQHNGESKDPTPPTLSADEPSQPRPTKTDEVKLKKPQLRILQALKEGQEMSRAEIALAAKVDNASLTGYIGSLDPVIREKNDTSWYPSLISMGLVNTMVYDERGKDVTRYFITKQGKERVQ